MKRAVLDEQNKSAKLSEIVRVNETNLRRAEQEVDSLGFRNKQLEHRVASLQDDLNKDSGKKSGKNAKSKEKSTNSNSTAPLPPEPSSVLSEEFQKKIFECAQLTSSLADKNTEIQLQANRIEELDGLLRSMNAEQTETESRLSRQVELLTVKTRDLEAKLADATSIVGSDDTLYASELEQHRSINSCSNISNNKVDERLITLEKELVHWRTQCEILQMKGKLDNSNANAIDQNKIENDNHNGSDSEQITSTLSVGEQLLIDNYSKKIEDLLTSKCLAESKLAIYVEEVIIHFLPPVGRMKINYIDFFVFQSDSLQKHLSIVNNDLKEQERKFRECQRNLQLADEDLVSIKIRNYVNFPLF